MSVVNQYSASDGIGGIYTNSFLYYGAKINRQGRGFAGFGLRRGQDSRNGIWDDHFFLTSFPFTGMGYSDRAYQPNWVQISENDVNVGVMTLGSGFEARSYPYVSSASAYSYGVDSATNGALLRSVASTNSSIDSVSGEVTASTRVVTEASGANGPSPNAQWTETATSYITNDTTNWCLGRAYRVTVQRSHTLNNGTAQTRTNDTAWDYGACRPTSTTIEPSTTLSVTTSISYDYFGNPTTQVVTGYGMNPRTTTTGWSNDGRFPISVTNALSQTATAAYNPDLGTIQSQTDPNGLTTSWLYDNYGRKTRENRPDGTYSVIYLNTCNAANSYCYTNMPNIRVRTDQYARGTNDVNINASLVYTDAFDRVVWNYTNLNRTGNWEGTYRYIDAFGRTTSETLPFNNAMSSGSRSHTYDLLGRETLAQTFNTSGTLVGKTTTAYYGLQSIVTDINGNYKKIWTNAIGQVAVTNDRDIYQTGFSFDAFGNPITVTDSDAKTLQSNTFNIRGMKTSSNDADMGSWSYGYNAVGELTSQTDAKAQTRYFAYDLLGRKTSSTEPGVGGGTITKTWTYGTSAASKNIGALVASAISGQGSSGYSESMNFDALGRPITTVYNAAGTNYQVDVSYDSATGLLNSITDASGNVVVKESFDAWGKRRNPATWAGAISASDEASIASTTRRGYTGHTELDNVGLVHMNGRVYDPVIGRFLSADPFVQAPDDTQSWNRYAFVRNSPLCLVDPSGYSWLSRAFRSVGNFVQTYWRPIVAIAAAAFTYGAVSSWIATAAGNAAGAAAGAVGLNASTAAWAASHFAMTTFSTSFFAGAAAGAVAGGITGGWRGALAGAVTGGILGGTAVSYGNRWTLGRIAIDGTAGGIGSEIQGGRFAQGLAMTTGFDLLRWSAYQMRQEMIQQSCTPPGNLNCTGVSAGTAFDGDTPRKLGGGRFPQWLRRLGVDKWDDAWKSELGGNQGQRGYFGFKRFGYYYDAGSFTDHLIESYAGSHDWLSSFRYAADGDLISLSPGATFAFGVYSAVAIIPATPFAVATAFQSYSVVPVFFRDN